MKIVKYITYFVFGIFGLILIVALFVPNDVHYEKSVTIDKPIDIVWKHTNNLKVLEEWNPMKEYDAGLQKSYVGKDGVVGSKSFWESNHIKIGKGSEVITVIEAPKLIMTEREITKPYKMKSQHFVKLRADGSKTIVTLGFDSHVPYPSNITNLFVDIDASIGKDYEAGLKRLKQICEQK